MLPNNGAEARPLSIVLLARSLESGGAERQMVELAIGLHRRAHRVRVAVFYARGALTSELQNAGVEIVDLRKSGRWHLLAFLIRTIHVLRRLNPDIIYSFLGGANVVAALARPFAASKIIWSVRNSAFDNSVSHWLADLSYRLEAVLAGRPKAIIANSSAGRTFAISRGFAAQRIEVVPNGIDTEWFKPDAVLRRDQRRKLGLRAEDIAVGVLGRLNATKDFPTFLRAIALLAGTMPKARFLCVGGGEERDRLERLARELGIANRLLFTGELDAAAALNAFDIFCSPSVTEGFSNAIAEAMACGLPCIVTDVGDSAMIVGDAGIVVPPSSPEALAKAIEQQIRNLGAHDPARPRRRIVDNFSMDAMVERTLDVFRAVLAA